MDHDITILLEMLRESGKGLQATISEIKKDMNGSFSSIKSDIGDIDSKLNKNMVYTSGELSAIKEQLKTIRYTQGKQEESIGEIREKQLTCIPANNWSTMVKAVSDIDNAISEMDDEITDIHSIDRLRRKSGLDKNGNELDSTPPSKRKGYFQDLPKWLPLLLAIITAAGIIGGAAAIQLAKSDPISSIYLEDDSGVDLDSDYDFK